MNEPPADGAPVSLAAHETAVADAWREGEAAARVGIEDTVAAAIDTERQRAARIVAAGEGKPSAAVVAALTGDVPAAAAVAMLEAIPNTPRRRSLDERMAGTDPQIVGDATYHARMGHDENGNHDRAAAIRAGARTALPGDTDR